MPNILSKITCPYCFQTFNSREAKFRCINQGCRREEDSVLLKVRNLRMAPSLGHVFERKVGGWRDQLFSSVATARCDLCNTESSKRLCPYCHFELSHDAGLIDDHIIAIIGGRDTGKGHYIASLVSRLENEIGQQFQFSLRMLGDDTRERFENDYRTPLFRNKKIIQPTQSATVDATVKTPMVFRLTIGDRGRLKALNLSFFDSAGEDMQSLDTLSTEARYICYASGIIFLLDPLQIDAVRQMLPPEILPPRDVQAEPTYIIERLRELFERQFHLSPTARVQVPVAFVLSKADALLSIMDPGTALKMTGEHFGYLNLSDAQSVHTEIESYLQAWMGSGFTNRAEKMFENFHYFGVSSLGHPPTRDGKVEVVSPIRVEDPFLWILYKLNLINGRKGR